MNRMKTRNLLYLPLRSKLVILFIALTVLPFIGSGFMTYQKYTSNVESSARTYTQQFVSQININLDNYLRELDKLTMMPFYDNRVLEILKNHRDPSRKPTHIVGNEAEKMSLFLSSLSFDRPEVKGVFLIANNGIIFSNLDYQAYNPTAQIVPWIKEKTRHDLRLFLIPPHLPAYYNSLNENVFSILREIRDPYSDDILGCIKIDLAPLAFNRIVDTSNVSTESNIYITDWKGNIFYPVAQQDKIFELPEKGRAIIEEKNYLTAYETSHVTGLNIIGVIAENDLKKDAIDLVRFTSYISIFSLLLAAILAILVASGITNPILKLQKKMKKVQLGHFDERATVMSRDEVGDLCAGFNVMMDEINRLVKEVYETRLRERDAELSALQNQISPHFIYNTFELINAIALENDQFEICDIISSLGKLLRYTVDKKERPVLLIEEIKFLKAYKRILTSRYGERLKIEMAIDPALEHCLVPKLILQPLVENAVQHGIKEYRGVIRIKASRGDHCLLLSVEDDGVGMPEEQYKSLEEKIYGSESYNEEMERFDAEKKGYALRNVHQRLYLLYGEQYGMAMDTTVEKGCKFVLRLPLLFSQSCDEPQHIG